MVHVCLILAVLGLSQAGIFDDDSAELMYEFVSVDYDWPSEEARKEAIDNGEYIVENNVITGIKVYNGEVYVTVSRWLLGVPSTMNKVIKTDEGQAILQPYPNWDMQKTDDCDVFQFTQSMEIDPYTGHMWVIDAGRRNIWEDSINNCPPQLFIVDLHTDEVIHTYTFPNDVLSYTGNFVNDIVLDLRNQFAYMSDVGRGSTGHHGGLVAYDRQNDVSYRLEHRSMNPEPDGNNITIKETSYLFNVPIDGIALSPDTEYIFYCPLGGYNLWRIPSSVARDPDSVSDLDNAIDLVGRKISQADGMIMSDKSLYYAAMELNAVYKWEYERDMDRQGVGLGEVTMETETLVAEDYDRMVWSDTFAFDEDGWLWYTPNQLPMFRERELDFDGRNSNFFIWKVETDEKGYLYGRDQSNE